MPEDMPVVGQGALEYYGTKKVWAWPSEKDGVPGYAVRYKGGYTSWSPEPIFKDAYQLSTAMSFGHAVKAMKEGYRVYRSSWIGHNKFIFLVQGSEFQVNRPPLNQFYVEGTKVKYGAHIDMRNSDKTITTWSPKDADLLGDDWSVISK